MSHLEEIDILFRKKYRNKNVALNKVNGIYASEETKELWSQYLMSKIEELV